MAPSPPASRLQEAKPVRSPGVWRRGSEPCAFLTQGPRQLELLSQSVA